MMKKIRMNCTATLGETFAGYENQYVLAIPVLARSIDPECIRERMDQSE